MIGRAGCIRLTHFHLSCISPAGQITISGSVIEEVIRRPLLTFTTLEPCSDCSLFIEAEPLQSLDHFELFLADADFVRGEGPGRRSCTLHGCGVGHGLAHEIHEDGWVGRNGCIDLRLILLKVAHDTLIGCRVIAHLLEQLLIVLVGDHLHKRPFHFRRVPFRC